MEKKLLVVHTSQLLVVVLLQEWLLTKKRGGTNEHLEGQTWNVGVTHFFLYLYKKKISQLE
jgi:hypothetical protein